MRKSLILIAVLASVALASDAASGSASLAEAFKNGKFSGDITAWSESRHINKGQKSTYYANTSYIVGSIGLGYGTDFYKNFSYRSILKKKDSYIYSINFSYLCFRV